MIIIHLVHQDFQTDDPQTRDAEWVKATIENNPFSGLPELGYLSVATWFQNKVGHLYEVGHAK
jgi:hypothetical protein